MTDHFRTVIRLDGCLGPLAAITGSFTILIVGALLLAEISTW